MLGTLQYFYYFFAFHICYLQTIVPHSLISFLSLFPFVPFSPSFSLFLSLSFILFAHVQTFAATTHNGIFWFFIVIIIATAAAADVGALFGTLAVEKDWVVVVTAGDS